MTEIEPDACKWRDNVGLDQASINDPTDPWCDYNQKFGKEPLYSAETIQIAIDRLIENHEESHQKVRECDAENCEYDSSEQEHAEQEFMIVGRKQALRELKEVFSE